MSLYGRITAECDSPKCHAEYVFTAEAFCLDERTISAKLEGEGWHTDSDGNITCPECLKEEAAAMKQEAQP